jgi:hypothetical protein
MIANSHCIANLTRLGWLFMAHSYSKEPAIPVGLCQLLRHMAIYYSLGDSKDLNDQFTGSN